MIKSITKLHFIFFLCFTYCFPETELVVIVDLFREVIIQPLQIKTSAEFLGD